MQTQMAKLTLAVLGGIGALLIPNASFAGNVGYHGSCWGGDKVAPITLAGHTAVATPVLSAGALASLNALVIERCSYYGQAPLASFITPDVKAAVANGMKLIVNDWDPGAATAAALPGYPSVSFSPEFSSDINIAAGSPVAAGPGGALTDSSLDGGSSSYHGYTATNLAASNRLLTSANAANAVAMAYPYGSGLVIYNAIPMDAYLTGAALQGNVAAPGMRSYLTNLVAASLNGSIAPAPISFTVTTTCASEGYTGTKLTWCKNICEMGYTGATLDMWIHRWINRYRDLPYCAVEGGGEEEPPPQEG